MNKALILLLFFSTPFIYSSQKPNIILFLVDDMGLMDTSVPFLTDKSGNPVKHPLNNYYKTPAMAKLAEQGVRFSQFYANSVCSPTRATLMTGQSSARHKITQYIKPESNNAGKFGPKEWRWEGLNKNDTTLPSILKKSGYYTIHCGKAHFAPIGHEGENPQELGFDVNIAGCAFGAPGSYLGLKNFGYGDKKRSRRAVPGLKKYHGKDIHLTEALTLELNDKISECAKNKKPFFAYMSHYAVHSPFEPDNRFFGSYEAKSKSKNAAAYASLIEGMDKSLNDIMTNLEKLGIAEDTFIIFVGDNGSDAPLGGTHTVASSAPLRGKKGTHYEGGMRVPFIASWAKVNKNSKLQKLHPVKRGIVNSSFANIADIFPTILKMANAEKPAEHVIDGENLLPVFLDHKKELSNKFLMHFPHSHRSSYFTAYRENEHKLVVHYFNREGVTFELFNLETDPYEEKNLASSQKDLLKSMLMKLQKQLLETGAQMPNNSKGEAISLPKIHK